MSLILLLVFSAAVLPASAETTRWYAYEEGMLAAGSMGKPVIIDFFADWCPPCIAMEEGTYPEPMVVSEMKDFIAIKVDTQKRIDIESKYGITYYPTIIILDSKGKEVSRHIGYLDPPEMVNEIKQSRGKLPKETPGFEIIYLALVFMLLLFKKKASTRIS
ncbi:MAG: thioredoxin family protein [Candidatus Methanoperedens sp.]